MSAALTSGSVSAAAAARSSSAAACFFASASRFLAMSWRILATSGCSFTSGAGLTFSGVISVASPTGMGSSGMPGAGLTLSGVISVASPTGTGSARSAAAARSTAAMPCCRRASMAPGVTMAALAGSVAALSAGAPLTRVSGRSGRPGTAGISWPARVRMSTRVPVLGASSPSAGTRPAGSMPPAAAGAAPGVVPHSGVRSPSGTSPPGSGRCGTSSKPRPSVGSGGRPSGVGASRRRCASTNRFTTRGPTRL